MPGSVLQPASSAPANPTHTSLLAINVLLVLAVFALVRYNLNRLVGFHIPDVLSIKGILSAGGVAAVGALVPEESRKQWLERLQTALDSNKAIHFLAALVFFAALPLCFLRVHVSWSGPEELTINVDGRNQTLKGTVDSPKTLGADIYAMAGHWLNIRVGAFQSNRRVSPFRTRVVAVPFYATSSAQARYAHIEYGLIATFFVLFDKQQLDGLRTNILQAGESVAADPNSVKRLAMIRDAIDSSANTTSTLDTKIALVDNFSEAYGGDPWIPLLRSQALYASGRYDDCSQPTQDENFGSSQLITAIRGTREFLVGMCQIKAIIKRPGNPEPEAKALAAATAHIQAGCDVIQATPLPSDLKDAAKVGALIYHAIGEYYSGDMQRAYRDFVAYAKLSSPTQAARAHNNAGFAAFVLGDYQDADREYNLAYKAQPNWPFISENIAYLKLAQGNLLSARAAFVKISDSVELKKDSPQDVILSKLILLELDNEAGHKLDEANNGYSELLGPKGVGSWEFERDPRIRYAHLVDETIRKVYVGGDYFGLEMFALTSACKARNLLQSPSVQLAAKGETLEDIQADIVGLGARVSPNWTRMKHVGWFSHLDRCLVNNHPKA